MKDKTKYESPICFKDKSKVNVKSNWFHAKHEIPIVTIEYCQNKPKCKSKNETRTLLKTLPFYVIS